MVLLFGKTPPPYGGVQVHVRRLHRHLRNKGEEVELIDLRHRSVHRLLHDARTVLFNRRPRIAHIHFCRLTVKLLLAIVLKVLGYKVVHTFHSLRHKRSRFKWIRLIGLFSDKIVAVGDEVRQSLLAIGVPEHKIELIPSFLPPLPEETVEADLVNPFAHEKDAYPVVINGTKYCREDGIDIYGFDTALEALAIVRSAGVNAKLFVCVGTVGDEPYYRQLVERSAELGLTGHVEFVVGKKLVPYIAMSRLFIRPTTTDSFGVSIVEALSLGVPAIASDVCTRPAGAELIPPRDPKALADAMLGQLSNPRRPAPSDDGFAYLRPLIDLYDALQGRRRAADIPTMRM